MKNNQKNTILSLRYANGRKNREKFLEDWANLTSLPLRLDQKAKYYVDIDDDNDDVFIFAAQRLDVLDARTDEVLVSFHFGKPPFRFGRVLYYLYRKEEELGFYRVKSTCQTITDAQKFISEFKFVGDRIIKRKPA